MYQAPMMYAPRHPAFSGAMPGQPKPSVVGMDLLDSGAPTMNPYRTDWHAQSMPPQGYGQVPASQRSENGAPPSTMAEGAVEPQQLAASHDSQEIRPDERGNVFQTSIGNGGASLFIWGIPREWSDQELDEFISKYDERTVDAAPAVFCLVQRDPSTGSPNGRAIVNFKTEDIAAKVRERINGLEVQNNQLQVELARV